MLIRRNQAKSIYEYSKSRHIGIGKGLRKRRATQAPSAYTTPLATETQEGLNFTVVTPPAITVNLSYVYGDSQLFVSWSNPIANSTYFVALYGSTSKLPNNGFLIESIAIYETNSYTFSIPAGGLYYYVKVGITYAVTEGCYKAISKSSASVLVPLDAPTPFLSYTQGVGVPVISWNSIEYATGYIVTFYRISLECLGVAAESSDSYVFYTSPASIPADFLLDSYYYYATVQAVNANVKGLVGTTGVSVQYYAPIYKTNVDISYAEKQGQLILSWPFVPGETYTLTVYTNTTCSTTGGTVLCIRHIASSPTTVAAVLQPGLFYYATVVSSAGKLDISTLITADDRAFNVPLYRDISYYPNKFISTRIIIDSYGTIYTGPESDGSYYALTDDMAATMLSSIDYISERAPDYQLDIYTTDYTATKAPTVTLYNGDTEFVAEWTSVRHATSYTIDLYIQPRPRSAAFKVYSTTAIASPRTLPFYSSPSTYYYCVVTPIYSTSFSSSSSTPGISNTISGVAASYSAIVQEGCHDDQTNERIISNSIATSVVAATVPVVTGPADYMDVPDSIVRTIVNMVNYISYFSSDLNRSIYLEDYLIPPGPILYVTSPSTMIIRWSPVAASVETYTVILYTNTIPSIRGGTVIANLADIQTSLITYTGELDDSLYYYATLLPFYKDQTPGKLQVSDLVNTANIVFKIPTFEQSDRSNPENATIVLPGTSLSSYVSTSTDVNAYTLPPAIEYAAKQNVLAIAASIDAQTTRNIYIDTYASPPAPVVTLRYSEESSECVITWTTLTLATSYILTFYSTTSPSTVDGGTILATGTATSPTVIPQILTPGTFYYATVLPISQTIPGLLGTSDILCANEVFRAVSIYESQSSFTTESLLIDADGNVYISPTAVGPFTLVSADMVTSMLNAAFYISGLANNPTQNILLENYVEYVPPSLEYVTATQQLIVKWTPIESAISYTCSLYLNTTDSRQGALLILTIVNVSTPTTIQYALATGFYYYITITPIFALTTGPPIYSATIRTLVDTTPVMTIVSVPTQSENCDCEPSTEIVAIDSAGHVFTQVEDGTFYEVPELLVTSVLNTMAYITGLADDPKENVNVESYMQPLPITFQYAHASQTFVLSWGVAAQATGYIVRLYSSTTVSTVPASSTLLSTVTTETSPLTLYQPLTYGLYYYATIQVQPAGTLHTSPLLTWDGITFTVPVTAGTAGTAGTAECETPVKEPVLLDASGNVYVSVASLGAFYQFSDDAVATIINGVDYISGLDVDPVSNIPVSTYRPNAAPTVKLSYALQANEFVISWPTVLDTPSYRVDLYSNTTYSTKGGTMIATATVQAPLTTLQHMVVKGLYYYATVTALPVNSWAPQVSTIVTLDSILYTVPYIDPACRDSDQDQETVIVTGQTVYVSTDTPGEYYKLTDDMISTVLQDTNYISAMSTGQLVDIDVHDYTSTLKPSISIRQDIGPTPLFNVQWSSASPALEISVSLYSTPIKSTDTTTATLVRTLNSYASFVVFPDTPNRTLFYFARVLALTPAAIADECGCGSHQEPIVMETTAVISPLGTLYTVSVLEKTIEHCSSAIRSTPTTLVVDVNGHFYLSSSDGIHALTDSMVYTILNEMTYISEISPASVANINLSDYSIADSVPQVNLEYSHTTQECIVSWTYLANTTAYTMILFSTADSTATNGTPVFATLGTSPTSIPIILTPGLNYYACVLPVSETVQGMLGTSNLLSSTTQQITVPVVGADCGACSSCTGECACSDSEAEESLLPCYSDVVFNDGTLTVVGDSTLDTLMASTLINAILYITSLSSPDANIYLADYNLTDPAPTSVFLTYSTTTQTFIANWPIVPNAASYTLTVYSTSTQSTVNGTSMFILQDATSPTTIPYTMAEGLYYYATIQTSVEEKQFLGVSELISLHSITYSIPLVANWCAPLPEIIVVDASGVYWSQSTNGVYTRLSQDIVDTIVNSVDYISGFTTDTGQSIPIRDYGILTIPIVSLAYSESANEFMVFWKYVPTATSYTVTLYENTVASMNDATILYTETNSLSTRTFSHTPVYGNYYFATVFPTGGVEGVSNLLYQTTILERIPSL